MDEVKSEPQRVVVTGVQMRFGEIFALTFQVCLAAALSTALIVLPFVFLRVLASMVGF